MSEKGIGLSPYDSRKIEHDVQEQLRVVLAPLLPRVSLPKLKPLPGPRDDTYYPLATSRRTHARIFFADLPPEKIWIHLKKYVTGQLYIHGEDVVAALLYASRHPVVGPNDVAQVLWHMRGQLCYLKPRHLATLFEACHGFGVKDKLFYDLLFKKVMELRDELDFRQVAEILISACALPVDFVPVSDLIPILEGAISRTALTMTTTTARLLHALAQSSWLTSTNHAATLSLVKPLLVLCQNIVTSMNAIDVAQSLEALRTFGEGELQQLGFDCRVLVRSLCQQALRTMDMANPLDVAESMRAAVYLQDSRMFEGLCVHASQKLSQASKIHPRALNEMMWALSRFKSSPPATALCSEVCVFSKACLPHFTMAQLCRFMESLSLLQVKDDELLLGVCEQVRVSVADLNPHTMVLLLEACVKLGLEHKPLLEALIVRATQFSVLEFSHSNREKLTEAMKHFGMKLLMTEPFELLPGKKKWQKTSAKASSAKSRNT
jgi:hypothetical protein